MHVTCEPRLKHSICATTHRPQLSSNSGLPDAIARQLVYPVSRSTFALLLLHNVFNCKACIVTPVKIAAIVLICFLAGRGIVRGSNHREGFSRKANRGRNWPKATGQLKPLHTCSTSTVKKARVINALLNFLRARTLTVLIFS